MTMPSPFEIGQQVGKNFAPTIRQQADISALDQILSQAKTATPDQQTDLLGQIISRVSPANRDLAMQYLQQLPARQERQEFLSGGQQPQGAQPLAQGQQRGQPLQQQQGIQPQTQQAQAGQPLQAQTQPEEEDFLQGTPKAIEDRARELMIQKPFTYKTKDQAIDKAEKDYQQEQTVLGKVKDQFNETLQNKLERLNDKDVNDAISGDLKTRFLREAQKDALKKGVSEKRAADQAADKLLDFGKSRSKLATMSVPGFLGLSTEAGQKKGQKNLSALRKSYEEIGDLELFKNDLINKVGLTEPVASAVAYPIKGNSEINQFFKDSKRRPNFNPFQGTLIKGVQTKQSGKTSRTPEQIADFVADNLKKDDSINSIMASFNSKNYPVQDIINDLQERWENGTLTLTKPQQRELQSRNSFRSSLRDLAFFSQSGLSTKDLVGETP